MGYAQREARRRQQLTVGSCTVWVQAGNPWLPIVDALAEQREVIAVDLPGFGEAPSLAGEVSIATLTDSVADFISEQGWDGVATAGQSMGGRMVLELARRGVGGDTVALDLGGFWSDRELKVFSPTLRPSKCQHGQRDPYAVGVGRLAGTTELPR